MFAHSTQLRRNSLISLNRLNWEKARKYKIPLALAVLHVPLGILLYQSSLIALIYPVSLFLFGVNCALKKKYSIEKIAPITSYLIGSEVLWRMSKSPIFWEFGKYSVAAVMLVALVRRKRWNVPFFPLLYLTFLVPAAIMTVVNDSFGDARDKISFNLSGPFLLFVCCWFFSHTRFNWDQIKKILVTMTFPLISVAVTTLFFTVTAEEIQFGTESNFATSGGFGPNQVSSMLGLGVFICLAIFLLIKNNFKDTLLIGALALLFAAQSVLTFSRGGMYNAIGATAFVGLIQLGNLKEGFKRLLSMLGIALLFVIFVFPFLNDFTGGALQNRFEDTDATGRADIIEADLHIFSENPLLGVGVGEAKKLRETYFGKPVGSHTEFARILSEHGMLGVLALVFLGIGILQRIVFQKTSLHRALTVGVVVWSCLFMMNAGMRMAAPSFMWGLSYLIIVTPQLRKSKLSKKTV